jgi:hypothetical protein
MQCFEVAAIAPFFDESAKTAEGFLIPMHLVTALERDFHCQLDEARVIG